MLNPIIICYDNLSLSFSLSLCCHPCCHFFQSTRVGSSLSVGNLYLSQHGTVYACSNHYHSSNCLFLSPSLMRTCDTVHTDGQHGTFPVVYLEDLLKLADSVHTNVRYAGLGTGKPISVTLEWDKCLIPLHTYNCLISLTDMCLISLTGTGRADTDFKTGIYRPCSDFLSTPISA